MENHANQEQVYSLIKSVILVYYLYSLPVIGDVFRKLINAEKEEKKDHPELKEDLIKVCITTASIILFNLEDSSSVKIKLLKIL